MHNGSALEKAGPEEASELLLLGVLDGIQDALREAGEGGHAWDE